MRVVQKANEVIVAESRKLIRNAKIIAGIEIKIFATVTLLKSGLNKKNKTTQIGVKPKIESILKATLLTNAFVSIG